MCSIGRVPQVPLKSYYRIEFAQKRTAKYGHFQAGHKAMLTGSWICRYRYRTIELPHFAIICLLKLGYNSPLETSMRPIQKSILPRQDITDFEPNQKCHNLSDK